jgi:hypothetical protein
MAAIKLELLPQLRTFAEEQADANFAGDISTYLSSLVAEDLHRHRQIGVNGDAKQSAATALCDSLDEPDDIERALLHSIEKGNARPMTPEDWNGLRERIKARAAARRRAP